MPYKNKRDLYVAQKRYRKRQAKKVKGTKEKLEFYEKTFGLIEWETI